MFDPVIGNDRRGAISLTGATTSAALTAAGAVVVGEVDGAGDGAGDGADKTGTAVHCACTTRLPSGGEAIEPYFVPPVGAVNQPLKV